MTYLDNETNDHTWPAVIISSSPRQIKLVNGKKFVLMFSIALGGWSGALG